MRIWHPDLLPKLCRQHLLAQWREGLGCYKCVCGEVDGFIHHPQTKAYLNAPNILFDVLKRTRQEMLNRGYKPKPLPMYRRSRKYDHKYREWQSLSQQLSALKQKGCECNI